MRASTEIYLDLMLFRRSGRQEVTFQLREEHFRLNRFAERPGGSFVRRRQADAEMAGRQQVRSPDAQREGCGEDSLRARACRCRAGAKRSLRLPRVRSE